MNSNRFSKIDFGFTLLELMLVIVIISIIATLGISVYIQHAATAKIDQTVTQMKLLQQAAANYYVDNNCWPNSTTCPGGATNFSNYVSLPNLNNPWGGQYTFRPEPNYQKKYQVWSGVVPYQAINRIIAQLPNAGIDPSNPNQALMEISMPPKQAALPSNILIQALGITPSLCDYQYGSGCQGTFSFNMSCPRSWYAWVIAAPTRVDTNLNNWFLEGNDIISELLAGSVPDGYCTKQSSTPTSDNYSCTIPATANTISVTEFPPWKRPRKSFGSARFMYIGACLKT